MEKLRVLLVEDDKVDRMAFKRFIDSENLYYDYTIANSVSEAKKFLAGKKFDVVIVDYNLGDGTAFDIFNLTKEPPIIVTTGTGNEEIAVKAMKAGAYDYLIKDLERHYLKVLPLTVENAIKHKLAGKRDRMLSHAIMSINDSVYITDMNDKIIFVNKAFCETYGYEEKEILGKHSNVLWKGESPGGEIKDILPKHIEGGSKDEFYHKQKDGTEFPVFLTRSVIMDENENGMAIVGVARDITERKRFEEELRRLSFLDELTGIANRRSFELFIEMEWKRSARNNAPMSILMIDIDFFKPYNDTYGHQAGDECLRRIARTINATLKRPGDMVARYGGEEFVVVLPDTDTEGASALSDLLRTRIEALEIAHTSSQVCNSVTISIGCATAIPTQGSSQDKLISAADQTLYVAKRKGRNRVEVCDLSG